MPPYESPKVVSDDFAKFIRVDKRLVTTRPGDMNTSHCELAKKDGILDELQKLIETDPNQVDAGNYFVNGRDIFISGNSYTLGIPLVRVAEKAREITIVVFEEQSPNHRVSKL